MRYKFKYFNKDGHICCETMKANNRLEIENYLKENNYKLIKFFTRFDYLDYRYKINDNKVSQFSLSLYYLLSAGVDINRAFLIISKQTNNKNLSQIALTINNKISQGYSINKSLELFTEFPVFFIKMIKIGENSGKLDLVLKKLADYYEAKWDSDNKLKMMLIYPITLIIGMIIVMVIGLIYVIPNYVELFLYSDVALPFPTLVLINLSNFFINNKIFLLIITFLIVIIGRLLFCNKKFSYIIDCLLLNSKIIGHNIKKEFNYNFTFTLSFLVDAGITAVDGIVMLNDISKNKFIIEKMNDLINKIKKGSNISVAMEKVKIFEPLVYTMTGIGIESGNLPEILQGASDTLKKDIDLSYKRIGKIIEIFVSIFIGAILCFVVLGIMLPNFQLANIL